MTQYKNHNDELLIIFKDFKIWHHYLEGCKYGFFIFTDYNNRCHFMDTKNLSSKQVYYTQKLLKYHFRIADCQDKANKVMDAFLSYSWQNAEEKATF